MSIQDINEQIEILNETKSQIKQAIISKGQPVTAEDSFRSYATKIENISTINAQEKTVSPTTSQQLVTPDQNYNALSQVTVNAVTNSIDSNIQANNIKEGVSILGVQGSVVELNGETKTVKSTTVQQTILPSTGKNAITEIIVDPMLLETKTVTPTTSQQIITPTSGKDGLSQVTIGAVDNTIDNNIQSSNIKSGITILGVVGTYTEEMKEYASETAMNNDLANIEEDEIVKVDDGTIITYYIKETTMKKLVKEEDTISPEEYEDNIDLVNEILGEEENS